MLYRSFLALTHGTRFVSHLPPPLTPELLREPHASIPRNPLIADPLFLTRYIEKAGTGTLDIIALCEEAGLLPPAFRQDAGQFVQTLWRPAAQATPQVTTEVTTEVVRAVETLQGEIARKELQSALGLKNDKHFRKAYLIPALDAGFVEMTIPDKPNSRLQKYRLTAKGRARLKGRQK